jgi:predicted ribosome quality control (RQC) complex YloA/Tae2 family protein
MNLEGIIISQLTTDLQKKLQGSIIYKVGMPNAHALLLQLKTDNSTTSLLADVNGAGPSLYFPEKLPLNPENPPAFCMLLRKHLEEGRVVSIKQLGLDRVIIMEIDILGKQTQIVTKKLIFELTGKNANIIFTQDDKIIDSIKHVNPNESSYRTVQPGADYLPPPPQKGLPILGTVSDTIVTSLPDIVDKSLLKSFITTTTGIGKASAQQIFTHAHIPLNGNYLTPADRKNLAQAITDVQNYQAAGKTFAVLISKRNLCQTIFPYPAWYVPEGSRVENFTELNKALLYAQSLEPIQLPEKELLTKIVVKEEQKLSKKVLVLKEDLQKAENADEKRLIADTLMANIYRLQQGQTQCTLESIYDGTLLQITLNPEISPAANAQAYYKKYNKFKRAQEEVKKQLAATLEQLDYLGSIDSSLLTASTRPEIQEIRQELLRAGIIPTPKHKLPLPAKSVPMRIDFSKDTTIYIGKNNRQNDYVTFKLGTGNDYWLHTLKVPGSHVLVKTSLPAPEDGAIPLAVELAAYYSKARGGSNIPVDCTLRKYVKKPAGSKPGFVIYTHQTTYYATPDEQKLLKLIDKKE